jgi:hypothetical protein
MARPKSNLLSHALPLLVTVLLLVMQAAPHLAPAVERPSTANTALPTVSAQPEPSAFPKIATHLLSTIESVSKEEEKGERPPSGKDFDSCACYNHLCNGSVLKAGGVRSIKAVTFSPQNSLPLYLTTARIRL